MNYINDIILNYFNKHTAIIFLVCDKTDKVISANKFTLNTIGKDIIGKNVKDFFVDFYSAFSIEEFSKDPDNIYLLNVTTTTGLPKTFHFKFIKNNEETVIIGETDSEEMDNLRRNLIILNNELNNITRELHKKNAELEKLNALKNQFLGMAAHDLRTPIGAIKSYTEFLLEETVEKLEQEHVKFLTLIKSLSDFMLQLLNDMLDITAIESGKIEYDAKPIKIVDVINESVEITSVYAKKKGIKVNLDIQDVPVVIADPIRIKQVIDNLLTNAIKFSSYGDKVEIKLTEKDDQIIVSVIDEGPGIPEGQLDRLFKPFSKTTVKSTNGEKSTGLGLVIAKKIVTSHHGIIWAENSPIKGAIFSFTLPKG